jgi:agmatine deiminase
MPGVLYAKSALLVGVCASLLSCGGARATGVAEAAEAPTETAGDAWVAVTDAPDTLELSDTLKLSRHPLGRVLRADWEPPGVLLVAYQPELEEALAELVAAASHETDVFVLASPEQLKDRRFSGRIGALAARAIAVKHDTPWIRDYGPLEVISEKDGRIWVDLSYYEERPLDDALPVQLSRLVDVQLESYVLEAEGGGVASNGAGVCAMTTSSFDKAVAYEPTAGRTEGLLWVLGCQSLAVVASVTGEETGHIDVFAQFLAQDLVAVAQMDPEYNSVVAAQLDAAAEAIVTAAEALEQSMRVVRVPMHTLGPRFYTYVNGTRVGKRFLVPHYRTVGASLELTAYRRLQLALPGVKLVPVRADPMVEQGGAVHCLTLGLGAS